jgi:hypothetical protein
VYLWLTGGKSDVRLGVSDTGSWELFGDAKFEFSSTHNDAELEVIEKIRNSPSAWSIHPADAEEVDFDGASLGLFRKVQEEPGKPHGMLVYYVEEPQLLGITLALPPANFAKVKEVLERVLLNDGLEFRITLSSIGIRVPESTASAPTAAEFLAGKPLLFDEVAVIVSHRAPMPNKSLERTREG